MATSPSSNKFINPSQIGGIEQYLLADGPARGSRVLCVNSGGGLRYRVLVDRGLDIDQAFMNDTSLSFLTFHNPTAPTRAFDTGLDWLKSFPGGLLTSCGPTNIGPPGEDAGETLGLHGPHSNTPASIEAIHQPDVHHNRLSMSVTGIVRYGSFYGPWLELRRTIGTRLGENTIDIVDEFRNLGNTPAPHAWLLHINFGYPLLDAGAELCFDSTKVEPLETTPEAARFTGDYKTIPEPMDAHRGPTSAVAYLYPRADAAGMATVAIVNRKRGLGVAIRYNTKQFPRCGNWQHLGPGEYVTALEPMNGTVDGRAMDRKNNVLDFIQPGGTKRYRYSIEVTTDGGRIEELRQLNGQR